MRKYLLFLKNYKDYIKDVKYRITYENEKEYIRKEGDKITVFNKTQEGELYEVGNIKSPISRDL
jgi:phage regulator Rha-like protein